MKRQTFFTLLPLLLAWTLITLTGCVSSKSVKAAPEKPENADKLTVKVKAAHDTYDLIEVPFEDYGYGWSYMTYVRPHYPAGVAKDIYETIWKCYVKTIERGDYDYDAFNKRNAGDPNWATPIGEYKDDPSFHFHGVCYQYADYFEMLIKKETVLKPLIDKSILRSETAPEHKYWVYQEPNGVKYYIDPTWGDWTIFGTPKGQFAGWIELSQKIEQSPARPVLTEAIMHSWFFIQGNAVGASDSSTRNYERSSHNL